MAGFNEGVNKYFMTKVIIILIILILIITAIFFIFKNNKPVNKIEPMAQGPKIQISPTNYDFGTVVYGDVTKREFIVTNTGSDPLQILKLSTSCGCTSAVMADEDKTIQPGKSVTMQVSFDPAVHKDDSDLGDLTRVIYIKSNDSNNSEVEATIKAFVIKN